MQELNSIEKAKHKGEEKRQKDYVEEVLKQLEEEKGQCLQLEKKLNEMNAGRLRMKKRKEAKMRWEIEKALTFLTSDNQKLAERFVVMLIFELRKEFSGNIIPTCSFLLYTLINVWKSDMNGCERLFTLIENSMKAILSRSNMDSLPFWRATASSLLQLVSNTDFLSDIPQL